MPQGRRKVPYSGKQKKQQLLEKKHKHSPSQKFLIRKIRDEDTDDTEISEGLQQQIDASSEMLSNIQRINLNAAKDPRSKSNRYVLQFHKETNKQLKEMREQARMTIEPKGPKDLEISDDYFEGYAFPLRPRWTYEMSKEQVEANEQKCFFKYISLLEKMHYDDMKELSYFELNIETWRQLWRVLEISDVILVIVDCRMPSLMFPPSLYHYVNKDLGKQMILVLNKIDLVDSELVLAWKAYFQEKYPDIKIVLFTSYPSYNLRGHQENSSGLKIRRRRGKMKMVFEGAQQVYQSCKEIVGTAVDLSSWEQKITEEAKLLELASGGDDEEEDKVEAETTHEEEKVFEFEEHIRYKNGVLTVGCVGFPNVGKSSLMNALMGKKVVSVSRTPGHTKHFQTIFLTRTVRLCDCPGLVFPSSTPRKIQVLLGSYPIAQLREPYASIKYIAERINLPDLLSVKHPEGDDEWSAIDICDAWALKRGFLTAKTGRPDTYRAANSILRMALDGKITLSLTPPGFTERAKQWLSDPGIEEVRRIQALGKVEVKSWKSDFCSDTEEEGESAASSRSLPKINNDDDADEENTGDEEDNANSEEEEDSEMNKTLTPSSNLFDLLDDADDC